MRLRRNNIETTLPTEELRAFVERSLTDCFGRAFPIARLRRRRSAYQTSFPLEELTVEGAEGTTLRLMLKRLDRAALSPVARRAKPEFLADPRREPDVYQLWLNDKSLGTPRCYGALVSETRSHHFILLEHIGGRGLNEVGEFEVWTDVAAWLAHFHQAFPGDLNSDPRASCLLRWRWGDYERWLARATAYTSPRLDDRNRGRLMWQFTRAVESLLRLPNTLIHGEFFSSNVLIEDQASGPRVCPVDWEMAALGPGILDLAALVAGSWSEEQRQALANAYFDARHGAGEAPDSRAGFGHDLCCARLVLAVQRLGWADEWQPPREHRHDWLDEALSLVSRLEESR